MFTQAYLTGADRRPDRLERGAVARRLVVMGNPAAGGADDATRQAVLDILGREADVVVQVTERPADIERALEEHADRVPVVLGGDGSLHTLVAALLARDELATRPVGLVPMGTGNDMARALGIPLDPREAATIVLRGRERRMDLLVDDQGGIVVNAVHVGVGALASEQATPLKPWLRRAAYAVGALLAGLRAKGWRLGVRVDGETVADGRRRILMVGVGNGTSIGGGTPLTPDARPDDGLADVVVSFAVSPWARLAFGVLLRLGRQRTRDDVVTLKGRSIAVDGEPAPANADGELGPAQPSYAWTLRPSAWRIIAPDAPGVSRRW
ncbi:diacylglycerol/lipid kinase family protein [Nonomuraea aurantiaca]|uniref:diacylglycerol/lipid kinase family protein n=1 Tax=Nonomuraea aurantiaca TaxID=2878562 RepID=UPI001CDA2F74|nr:diacylglycerol kinase family protein [Nonomuraea aurantiaca]MCA2223907.1 lipid kinase [Nonomuraea aurantiaca]